MGLTEVLDLSIAKDREMLINCILSKIIVHISFSNALLSNNYIYANTFNYLNNQIIRIIVLHFLKYLIFVKYLKIRFSYIYCFFYELLYGILILCGDGIQSI